MKKFEIGTKVKVTADLTFKGLTGIVAWSDKDEDGEIQYLLHDIECPVMLDKNNKEYQINKTFFYESWLTKD
jgi:hypothetical protein